MGGTLVKASETIPELTAMGSTLKFLSILLGVILLFIGFQLAVRDTSGQTSAVLQTPAKSSA
jgi:predicted tellurium resistance membrane protein TerC